MATPFPPDIGHFVQSELAAGNYRNESELVLEALKAFRELKLRYRCLLDDVREAIAQADRDELHELNTEATKSEARRRFADKTGPS